ncbi:MAG: hypothetical protein JST22_14645 [Bacteroidetes bacterium]|nr:hypothetical protein [Bacteroidota bacterium]
MIPSIHIERGCTTRRGAARIAARGAVLKYRAGLILLLLCSAVPAIAGGGAWNMEEGKYYGKVELSSLTATHQYGLRGQVALIYGDTSNFRNTDYGTTDISFYGELGFNDWLTGVASTEYKVAVLKSFYRPTGRDSTASASGLGDLWLGARIRLLPLDKDYAAAVTVGFKLPTGSPLQAIPLGTGVVDYELAAAVGSSFVAPGEMQGYAQLSGGYRLRNGKASDELNYQAEVGAHLGELFVARAVLDGVHSFATLNEDPNHPDDFRTQDLVGNQSYTRFGLGVVYNVNPGMELNVGYHWNTGGRNALQLSGLSVGIAWKN